MEAWRLEHLIKEITNTLDHKDDQLAALYKNKGFTGNDPEWLKNHMIPEICSPLSGTLGFLRSVLEEELEARKSKKFYQFWK